MISFQNVTYSYKEKGEPKSLDSTGVQKLKAFFIQCVIDSYKWQ